MASMHLVILDVRLCRRSPNYTVGRLVVSVLMSLLLGLTWWGEGTLPDAPDVATIAHLQNILGSIYAGLSFIGIANMIAGLPVFIAERNVMYRCARLHQNFVHDARLSCMRMQLCSAGRAHNV